MDARLYHRRHNLGAAVNRFPRQIAGGLSRLGRSAGVAAPVSPFLLFDSFTGANGTLIESRPPDVDVVGGGWVRYSAAGVVFQISSNQAISVNSPSYAANVGAANVTGGMKVIAVPVGSRPEINIRLQDSNNLWFMYCNYLGQFITINERNAGVNVVRVQVAGVVLSLPFDFNFSTSGNVITASVTDGTNTNTASFTSAFLTTATRFGPRAAGANVIVDDFFVDAP